MQHFVVFKFCGIHSQHSHTPWLSHSSHSILQMGYTGRKIPDVIPKSLSHLLKDLWGDSSRTCRWHPSVMLYDPWNRPCRCWCFESWHCFSSSSCFISFLLSSPLPFLPRNEWATWGWWPVTDREETRLSTLSDSQSEWLTVEQVTPLGIDSHSLWFVFAICHIVTIATTCIIDRE